MKWLVCLALVGCAHQGQRTAEVAGPRCVSVEVFPNGMTPGRPYRVLGSVQTPVGDMQTTAAEQMLVREACRLGADAIIVDPRDMMPFDNGNRSYLVATAVVYTDTTPPPVAPAQ